MLALAVLTSMAMAAEPVAGEPVAGEPVAVVLARRTGVTSADAAAVVASAAATLGLPEVLEALETTRRLARMGLKDATWCKGREACLAELGQQLEVRWLVLVSVSQLGKERSLGLELLQVGAERVVERAAVLLASEAWLSREAMVPFVERATARIEAAARLAEALRAGPSGAPEASPLQGRTPSLVLGSAGAAALAAAVVLLVVGVVARSQLSQGDPRGGAVYSGLTASEAQAAAARATGALGGAGAAAAVGLGLGVVAVLTW